MGAEHSRMHSDSDVNKPVDLLEQEPSELHPQRFMIGVGVGVGATHLPVGLQNTHR